MKEKNGPEFIFTKNNYNHVKIKYVFFIDTE